MKTENEILIFNIKNKFTFFLNLLVNPFHTADHNIVQLEHFNPLLENGLWRKAMLFFMN